MGMFDHIWCEVPLPDGLTNKVGFQTKDLVNELAWFEIKQDGLYRCHRGQRIFYAHTGHVSFYAFINDATSDGWREFVAGFVNGELKSLSMALAHDHHPSKQPKFPVGDDQRIVDLIEEKGDDA